MILIAKTSFVKSMIFQAPSIMLKGQVTIILLPLNQIGIEQSEKIAKLGGKPCFLNGDLINSMVLKDLRQGKYTHLLFSPELALGDRLRPIIIDLANRTAIAAVCIDEAHLVFHWGVKLRKDYAQL